jgi:hypothetical protein
MFADLEPLTTERGLPQVEPFTGISNEEDSSLAHERTALEQAEFFTYVAQKPHDAQRARTSPG